MIVASLLLVLQVTHAQQYQQEWSSLDGSNNNIAHPEWASLQASFVRVVPPAFGNGSSPAGAHRPSARQIADALFGFIDSVEDAVSTANQLQLNFGQLIAHEISNFHENASDIFPISVPSCDIYLDRSCSGNVSLPFKRAMTNPPVNGIRQISNFCTGYVDAGAVYGFGSVAPMLRVGRHGLLVTIAGNFPPLTPITSGLMATGPSTLGGSVFLTGDARQSVNPAMSALTIVFYREHNRRAEQYAASNPQWDDETIFQSARKMVIGEMQYILYSAYVPALIGAAMPQYTGYKPSVNPGIDMFFSAAAFRYGHSGIPAQYLRYGEDGKPSPSGPLVIRDCVFNSECLLNSGIESLLLGLLHQPEQAIDTLLSNELRNKLDMPGPCDVAAWNIQRGRDVGLPSYNAARTFFNLTPADTWSSISSSFAVQQILARLYTTIDDVDAWVGGLAEDHVSGGRVGPLFAASITEQFIRLRDGDRFYFENNQTGLYSDKEIADIKNTSLAEIIRQTSKIAFPDDALSVPASATSTSGSPTSSTTNSAQLGGNLMLTWVVGSDSIQFDFLSKSNGWYAVGFGSSKMAGADIQAVSMTSAGLTVSDMYSNGEGDLSSDVSKGGTADDSNITDISSVYLASGYVRSVRFYRKFSTGDQYDHTFIKGESTQLIFAWSDSEDVVGYHGGNRGAGVINLFSSSSSGGGLAILSDTSSNIYALHGSMMLVTFGVLYPFGGVVARYLRRKNWMKLHSKVMQLASSHLLISVATAVIETNWNLMETHTKIGVAITLSMMLTTVMGSISPNLHNAGQHQLSKAMRVLHPLIGILTMYVGWYNCILGMGDIAPLVPQFVYVKCFWYFWVSALSATFIALEFRRRFIVIDATDATIKERLPEFTLSFFKERVSGGDKWVICDGVVYDVSNVISNHPGGSNVLQNAVGTDVSKYFFAEEQEVDEESGVEGKIKWFRPHRQSINVEHFHSKFARDQLFKCGIGLLKLEQMHSRKSLMADVSSRKSSIKQRRGSIPYTRENIISTHSLASAFTEISKQRSRQHSILTDDDGLSILSGDIQSHINSKARSSEVQLVEKRLITNPGALCNVYIFKFSFPKGQEYNFIPGDHVILSVKGQLATSVSRSYTPIKVESSGHIELLIKVYNTGKLTSQLERLPSGSMLKMKGPIHGKNLLCRFSQVGCYNHLYMIAAGTGLSPMLLLISYYLVYAQRCEQRPQLHLLCVNKTECDIIAESMLKDLVSQCKGMLKVTHLVSSIRDRNGQFNGLEGRISTEVCERVFWTDETDSAGSSSPEDANFRSQLVQRSKDEGLAVVCGPAQFCEAAKNALLGSNVSSDNIQLLL